MLSYIIRRLAIAVPTLVLVSIFVFTLQKLLPGDPALVMAGEERDPASIEFIREKYHLNEPVITQYVYWMKAVLQGDMGVSLRTDRKSTRLNPVTNAHLVCRLLLEKKKTPGHSTHKRT